MLAARLARTFMVGRAGQPMYYGKMVSIGVPVKDSAKDKKPSPPPPPRTRKPERKTSSETDSSSPGSKSFLTQENRSGKISSRSSPYDGTKEKKKQQPHPRFTQQKTTPTKPFHLSPGLVGSETLLDLQSFLQTPADPVRTDEKTQKTPTRRNQDDDDEPKKKWSFDKKKATPNFKKNKDKEKNKDKDKDKKDLRGGKQKAKKEDVEYVDQSTLFEGMQMPPSVTASMMGQFKSVNEVFSQQKGETTPEDSLIDEEIQAERQKVQEQQQEWMADRKRPTKKDKTKRTVPVEGSLSFDQIKRYFNNQMDEGEMSSLPQGPLDKLMTKEDYERWQNTYLDYTPLDHERDQADRIFQYHHLTEPFAFCSVKSDLPSTVWPEFAFAGRSNVGKSSLLNAVAGINKLARVSSTPGRTQTINFFKMPIPVDNKEKSILPMMNVEIAKKISQGQLNKQFIHFVDLPGYGFTKAPPSVSAQWQSLVSQYLRGRPQLQKLFLLIDSRIGLQKIDREFVEFLETFAIPFQVVLTKTDKLSAAEVQEMLEKTQKEVMGFSACFPWVVDTSSANKNGISNLKVAICRMASLISNDPASLPNKNDLEDEASPTGNVFSSRSRKVLDLSSSTKTLK